MNFQRIAAVLLWVSLGGVGFAQDQAETLVVDYDEGLRFSWDGGHVGLEGLFEVGGMLGHGARTPGSDFYLKRFRPELFGSFDGGWRFRFEPKFTEGSVELEEAWVGREISAGTLRLGRMKAPFGLEETRSRRHIHFPRFSILNQFSPAEDHGVFLTGRKGGFEYGAALINGSSGADQDDGKDLALRGMWHFGDLDTPGGRRFQIGLAGTAGRQEFSVAGDGFKNAGGARMLELAAGANLDGARTRVGLELAGMQGPWMFQGELLTMDQEMLSGAVEARGTVEGGYFELARALGGEDLDFGGVANPHDSWVAALRVSSLDFGGALADPMFVAAGMSPGRVDSVSLGLSHIPGAHTIWRGALAMSSYDDDIVVGSTSLSEETVLTVELQLHF